MWTFIDFSLQRRSLSSLSNSRRFRRRFATGTSTSRCRLPTSQASTSTHSPAFLSTANTRRSPRGGKRVLALWMDHSLLDLLGLHLPVSCFPYLLSPLSRSSPSTYHLCHHYTYSLDVGLTRCPINFSLIFLRLDLLALLAPVQLHYDSPAARTVARSPLPHALPLAC